VNPDHLRAVTPEQNVLENSAGLAAANKKKTACGVCGGPYELLFVKPSRYNSKGYYRHCPACQRRREREYRERVRARREDRRDHDRHPARPL
jgi:hypothetical protein